MITRDRINSYFNEITTLPGGDVFSEDGFSAFADWSARQPWWDFFAFEYLRADWRSAGIGDCYLFAVNLFNFLNDRSRSSACCFDDGAVTGEAP